MVQVLSTTSYHQMESVALLTKEIWISTPLVLGIVVCVARRLISYKKQWKRPLDCIVHGLQWKGKTKRNEAVQRICVRSEVQLLHRQQWQQKFAKDPNAMDLTPGCTCARAALTKEEQVTLQKEGHCFNCKKQGHIGRNCPLKAGGLKAWSGKTTEEADQTQSSIKRLTADELINIIRGMDKGEKDKMIQEVFMKEDFA